MYKYLGNAAFVRVPSSNLSKNIITQNPFRTIARDFDITLRIKHLSYHQDFNGKKTC